MSSLDVAKETVQSHITPNQQSIVDLIEAAKQKQDQDICTRARTQFLASANRDASAEAIVKSNNEMMFDAANSLGKLIVAKTLPGTLPRRNKNPLKRYEARTHNPEFFAEYGHHIEDWHYGALSGNLLASEPEHVDGLTMQRSFNFLADMSWEYIVENPQSPFAPHAILPSSLVMFEVYSVFCMKGKVLARNESEMASFDLRSFLPMPKWDSKAKKPITDLPPIEDPENPHYLDSLAILQLAHDELRVGTQKL